ncbi:NAD(P)-binding protein [Aspergillus ellipticus CBS 707.79]|uniref:NAD(P)-binding protein n=1 Tax=Aspergillus ellipticus CBS 707.79 TaxID=1448320 RepID=A0A319EWE4_9EURO|nr:NAD(P)-binding protein [Aspergillus ellipticus CBS 707.79]
MIGMVTGAAGVIYVSTPVLFGSDPEKVVDPVVRGTINTLKAAARAGVQRYVLSSSSKAVEGTVYDRPHTITVDTFNHDDVRNAREGAAGESLGRLWGVYSASRAAAELAFWAWVKENKPPFVANCVVLDGNFGRVLDVENINTGLGSSTGMLKNALAGNWDGVFPYLAYFVDVQDSARLLVAATTLSTIANERIFGHYGHATWNDLRQIVQDMFPDRPEIVTGGDLDVVGRDQSNADELIQRAEELLKEVGRPGFVSVEDMLRDFVDSFY